MNFQTPFTFASALARGDHPLGVWPLSGLRLRTPRQFQAFLAIGSSTARASSYHFCSVGASFRPLGLTHRCSGSASPPTELSR